ncbi:MAG: hypothetical protein IT379_37300 [Deltaproteobacteria bacterium]|nr:hypothetical protein [Deltaproteobacteria bacterium]
MLDDLDTVAAAICAECWTFTEQKPTVCFACRASSRGFLVLVIVEGDDGIGLEVREQGDVSALDAGERARLERMLRETT